MSISCSRNSLHSLAVVAVAALSVTSCAAWCRLRGGDYKMVLPPDENETRVCVMPEKPAADEGKVCSDEHECVKNCACPDEVYERLSELHNQGVGFDELNGRYAPKTTGRCTKFVEDVGFTCHVVDGKAQVDMTVI